MFQPAFSYDGNVLRLGDSTRARAYTRPEGFKIRPAGEVEKEAKREVQRLGGDPSHRLSVLAFSRVQFGKFPGQTFKWLVENALGWCAKLVCSLERTGEEFDPESDQSVNKFALKEYLTAFSEGRAAVEKKRNEERREMGKRQTAGCSQSVSGRPPMTGSNKDQEATTSGTVTSTCQRAVVEEEDKTEYLLTEGWKQTLPCHDHEWVSHALFKESACGKPEFDMQRITQLWFYPPEPQFVPGQAPKPACYFATKLLMWMPHKLWGVKVLCPNQECNGQELLSAGVYSHVQQVMDIDGFYNMGAEYLECRRCHKKFISWSKTILDQLDTGPRLSFPVVLTCRGACDKKIVVMLRDRTLGNGPFQMIGKLKEVHTDAWLAKTAHYCSVVEEFFNASERGLIDQPNCPPPPAMPSLPTYHWLLTVYCNDVLERIDEVKASITSVFGRILKIDSSNKITRKLRGESAGTAAWATNVGNESGQVLMSVMTVGEGAGLDEMIKGIQRRYAAAGQPRPELLYVDRGCCGADSMIFREWPDMPVRLDVWHFMRRLARGCISTKHQLYPFFLRRLSACIFAWSADDLDQLIAAKRGELRDQGIAETSDEVILKHLGKSSIARHCRRVTRGTEETTQLIGDLLASLDGERGHNTHRVPLFDSDRVWEIWDSEQKHIACIQDPPGVQLYTKTGETVKGGITLPVYRCARGLSSLESFHLHMSRFIPGISANNVHFQAYLLEGVHRWNCDRARDVEAATAPSHVSYGTYYELDVNRLTEKLFGCKLNPTMTAPLEYTGELIGLEYLFNQTNEELLSMHPDEGMVEGDDDGEDVGRWEEEDVEDPTQPPPEFGVRPASSQRSSTVSSQQPGAQDVSTKPRTDRSHTPKARATVSRAPDSPPPTSAGIGRISTAPATVSRAPDSPRDDTPESGTLAGDEEVNNVEDVDLREKSDEEHTGRRLLKLRGKDDLKSTRDSAKKNLDPACQQEKITKGRFKVRGTQRHKQRSRGEESSAQGASAPRPRRTARRSVPPPKEKPPTSPPLPIQRPVQFPTISNTVGQATMKVPIAQPTFVLLPVMAVPSTRASTPAPTEVSVPGFRSIQPTPPNWRPSVPQPSLPPTSSLPRSTHYNRKRRAQQRLEGQVSTKVYKPRKGPIVCSQCHQPRDQEHHTQYYGSWYCDRSQNQPLAEWKTMMSERRLAKLKAEEKKAKKD
ncbi:uncharacterized protein LOC121431891 [Lytechinus variegatus]|uniref:uncharacterized protein LOC121431891 n=1 Tax=Lytechinus variegatus TaxID=7654 RepID=UPI001BB1985E|nr:uncharacterized protein LOC121431891 [Lytechinus variegatus]